MKKTLVGWADKNELDDFKFTKILCDGGGFYLEPVKIKLYQYRKTCYDRYSYDPKKFRITIEELK